MLVVIWVAFCCGSVVGATLLALATGSGVTPMLAALSLGIGLLLAAAACATLPRPIVPMETPRGWLAWGVISIFALFALRAFCWVLYQSDGMWMFASPNNFGDLSLHLTLIHHFALGAPFWPDNPIFAATSLRYPFGVDLFNGMLVVLGVDTARGLIWVGLISSLATGLALWRWGGLFALAAFLFNGGLAAWPLLTTGSVEDYQGYYAWKSIPLALFVTQRGLLYALPAGLLLLWSWRRRWVERQEGGLPRWLEVLLYATMPLFHLHTFLFLSGLLGFWFLYSLLDHLEGGKQRRELLWLVGLALLPATAQVWVLTGGFSGPSLIGLLPGWMQGKEPLLRFWLMNFGIYPLLVALLVGRVALLDSRAATRPEARRLGALVIPAFALWVLTFLVRFAPWEWDNTKLMLWAYLLLLPPLWEMIGRWKLPYRIVTIALLFFSGLISLGGGLGPSHRNYSLLSVSELAHTTALTRETPVAATFAAHPTFNHPLLLAGRKLVAGYPGHLMSHGIDYKDHLTALEALLRGERGWENLAHELGVDYLFWGRLEEEQYGPEWPPSQGPLPIRPVVENAAGKLYFLGAGKRDE